MLVSMIRAFLICAVATAPLLGVAPAIAFCSKPITPFCASDGNLTDSYITESKCRRLVEDHLNDLARYRNCLRDQIEQLDENVERFQNLLGGDTEDSGTTPGSGEQS